MTSSPDSMDVVVVVTTAPPDAADALATALVEGRQCACVNVVGPVRSVYRWKGAVCRDEEYLLVCKTTAEAADAVRAAIVERHPYELPEVVCLAVDAAHSLDAYLEWVRAGVAPSAR